MARLEKVIFDTNTIRNTEPKTFLWWREELKKFNKVSEIIIPDIVIEEIKKQKLRSLKKHKDSFLKNPFHFLKKLSESETKDFDNEVHVNELEKNEQIKFTIIKLSDYSVIEKMKVLATSYYPPFNKVNDDDKNNSDKWFKDAYIYFTVLEYVQKKSDEYVFFYTKDPRLAQAFNNNSNIKVIKNFEEFEDQTTWYFKKDYFIEKLKEILPEEFDSIWDIMYNVNNNWLVTVFTEDIDTYYVEVDFSTKEIIDFARKWDFIDYINDLINSKNFNNTDVNILNLHKYIQYLTDKEIELLIKASINNNQIYWIADKEYIKDFFTILYNNAEIEITESEDDKFCEIFWTESKYYVNINNIPF